MNFSKPMPMFAVGGKTYSPFIINKKYKLVKKKIFNENYQFNSIINLKTPVKNKPYKFTRRVNERVKIKNRPSISLKTPAPNFIFRRRSSNDAAMKVISKYKIRKLSPNFPSPNILPKSKSKKFTFIKQNFNESHIRTRTRNILSPKNYKFNSFYYKSLAWAGKIRHPVFKKRESRGPNGKFVHSPYIYIKNSTFEKVLAQKRANQALRRSFRILSVKSTPSKYTKTLKPLCRMFLRYGKCLHGNKCKFLHDQSKVAICTKFLRFGKCDSSNCKFSHEHSLDKMPLCQFFLKGACSRTDCRYLHVKHKAGAKICLQFQRGFCPNGANCDKLHLERENNATGFRMTNQNKRRAKQTKESGSKNDEIFKRAKPEDTSQKKDELPKGNNGREWPSFIMLSPSKETTDNISECVDLNNLKIIPSFLNF